MFADDEEDRMCFHSDRELLGSLKLKWKQIWCACYRQGVAAGECARGVKDVEALLHREAIWLDPFRHRQASWGMKYPKGIFRIFVILLCDSVISFAIFCSS